MPQDDRIIELLSGSLDGVLTAEESAELRTALDSSPEARALLAEMTLDKEAIRALPSLKVPDNLKQRALLKARAKGGSGGWPWRPLLMAASLLLVVGGTFYTFRPLRSFLHLRPGQLAMRAAEASEELTLAAVTSRQPQVLVSDALSGRYNHGHARVHFQCDAGNAHGGRVKVTLAFDFDGDGQIDKRSAPQVLEIDDQEGYQDVACKFTDMDGMQDMHNGKVQVELSSESEQGPPVKVKFEPQQAKLDLPFDNLLPPGAEGAS